MKFVIGLLIGSIGVLAAVTVADYSWEPPKRSDFVKAPVATASVVAEPEPKEPEPTTREAMSAVEPEVIRSVTVDPLVTEPLAPEPVAPEPLAIEPLAAEPEPALAPLPGLDVVPGRDVVEETEVAVTDLAVTPSEETAVVWKPFHSEVSAQGFARRLSVQLGYPFRAMREGPATYQVVFDYSSDEQREVLRQQVEALTGFSVI